MRKSYALISAAALALAAYAGPSLAAAPAAGSWTGFYVGGHFGGAFGTSEWSDIVVPSDTYQDLPGHFLTSSTTGIVGGVQGGYNYQWTQYVFGVEADLSGSSLSGQQQCIGSYGDYGASCQSQIDFAGDITGRAGYVWDQALIYIKGGGAFAHTKFTPAQETAVNSEPGRIAPGYKTSSDTRWGPTIGFGVEYAFKQHWTLGAEYDYQDFGSKSVTFNPQTGRAGTEADLSPLFTIKATQQVNLLEVKLNYLF